MKPMQLITYPKSKYSEQVIALKADSEGGLHTFLFDAVPLFMVEDGMKHQKEVFERGDAKEFAEQFVAQFNAALNTPAVRGGAK